MTPEERITAVQTRVLLDAWLMGSRIFWERRARAFAVAAPRASDTTFGTIPDAAGRMLEAQRRCLATAAACRNRAAGLDGVTTTQLLETLDDVAAGGVV